VDVETEREKLHGGRLRLIILGKPDPTNLSDDVASSSPTIALPPCERFRVGLLRGQGLADRRLARSDGKEDIQCPVELRHYQEATMSEKDEIRELLARYCFALDADRFEEMAALFTPDGVWETAFGTGTGRDGIVAQARSISTGVRPRRAHLTTNIVIDLDGDTATARSNWVVVQNVPGGPPSIGSGGGYSDRLVKVDGRWFFKHRTIDRYIVSS
jgi:SnoaL-like domain